MKDLNVSLLSLLEMEKDLLNDIAFNNESASEFEKVGNLKIAKNYKDEKFRAEMRLVECRREIKRWESKHMCQRDYKEKRFAMTAAKQLGYGDAVIERIRQSNSLYEIDRIMRTARLNMPWR